MKSKGMKRIGNIYSQICDPDNLILADKKARKKKKGQYGIQISIGESKHIIFTGSEVMMGILDKLPKDAFPFQTTIVNESERYEFT